MTVYYSPEDFDLTTIGEISWDDEPYAFDLTVVWKDKDGNLYWASDSGCSCPSPFEDFTSKDQLETGNLQDFIDYINRRFEHRFPAVQKINGQMVSLVTKLI